MIFGEGTEIRREEDEIEELNCMYMYINYNFSYGIEEDSN